MNLPPSQLKALGTEQLPETVTVSGRQYHLEKEFKHTFAAAVGVYRAGEDSIVCKFHRRASFLGIPLAWLGGLMAAYEAAVLKQAQDLQGVPGLRGMPSETVVARDFIEGQPLDRRMRVGEEFFPQLRELVSNLHAKGMAYVDLEKAENILLGDDGRPYLFDFQVAFYVPRKLFGETALVRFVRELFQKADDYHVTKHFRRMRPDMLTAQQIAQSRRKPWFVRTSNLLGMPYKRLRRWMLRK